MPVIKNALPMTYQDLFDTVADHLLTQREACTEAGDCVYRGPNGLKCAIGALIPDDKYDETLEGDPGSEALRRIGHPLCDTAENPNRDTVFMNLVDELQRIHDEEDPAKWMDYLYSLGDTYNLDNSILSNYEPIT